MLTSVTLVQQLEPVGPVGPVVATPLDLVIPAKGSLGLAGGILVLGFCALFLVTLQLSSERAQWAQGLGICLCGASVWEFADTHPPRASLQACLKAWPH